MHFWGSNDAMQSCYVNVLDVLVGNKTFVQSGKIMQYIRIVGQ